MFCKICGSFFNVRRTFSDLLTNKKYYLCHNCNKKYIIDLKNIVIPLDKHKLIVYSLFSNLDKKYFDYFYDEYTKIYAMLLKHNKVVISCDIFSEEMTKYYEIISKLFDNDIIILCYRFSLE